MKILMVCLGNICRSPMAEIIFQDLLGRAPGGPSSGWTVDSAGTNRHHKGGPADHRAIAQCHDHGLDLSHHIARRIVPEDFEKYDVLFSMARDVTLELRAFAPRPELMSKVRPFLVSGADVPDPWYGSEKDFASCFDLLKEASQEQLKRLSSSPL